MWCFVLSCWAADNVQEWESTYWNFSMSEVFFFLLFFIFISKHQTPSQSELFFKPCWIINNVTIISAWIKGILCLFQAGDRVIRSQFACTYKDEELPLNRVLEFPSTSQVPTCVHPAPKLKTTPAVEEEEECSSGVESAATGTDSTFISGSPTGTFCPRLHTEKSSKCQHEPCSILFLLGYISVSSDATQLDRGPGTPSQLQPWTLPNPSPGTGTYH